LRYGFALLLAAALTGCGGANHAPAALKANLPLVVLDSPDAPSWVRLLRAVGWSARVGDLAELLDRTGGVVPADASLSGSDRARILGWVERGGHLATPNDAVLEDLGVERRPPAHVTAVRMRGLAGVARWIFPLTLRPLAGPALRPLAVSTTAGGGAGGGLVMASRAQGRGELVAFAFDPAGGGRQGYEELPKAATLIGELLRAPPSPSSQGAEIFVDPGGLPEGAARKPAQIADRLARAGARVAEIAGWNYDFTDPAFDYDYASLIAALHARGILAYAWLEPPFVTLRFWEDHPECREQTQSGRDAFVDWRHLMALEDPVCFRLATASWRGVLTRYAWDGVNVAELYFEPPWDPNHYTPFSRTALAQFGRDPAKDPAAFERFRTQLVTKLNRKVLRFLNRLPNANHLGLELTVIDDTLDPIVGRSVGSDIDALSEVAKRAGATLIVEDPFTSWTDGPLRYDKLGPHVSSLMPPEAAVLDVNVVRRKGAKPTEQMAGGELGLALASATAPLGRIAIYSLGTLTRQDLDLVPRAMAAGTSTTDLGVYGRWTVKVTAPSPADGRLQVDGIAWPAARGFALVPPGNHVLDWSKGPPVGPGLTAFTGEIGTASVSSTKLGFTYETRPDGLAVVTRRPTSLRIDGASAALDITADPAGGFVVRLPQGNHKAELSF
jgi:hypothetical protein